MGYPESGLVTIDAGPNGVANPIPIGAVGDVGRLVMGAADGDDRAWQELVGQFSPLVSSIVRAHRLSVEDMTEVADVVWLRLDRHLRRIRQPDRVGVWLAAVTRDECVRRLTASA